MHYGDYGKKEKKNIAVKKTSCSNFSTKNRNKIYAYGVDQGDGWIRFMLNH